LRRSHAVLNPLAAAPVAGWLVAAVFGASLGFGPAQAQAPAAAPSQPASADPLELRRQIDARQSELRGLEDGLKASDEQNRRSEAEIEAMRNDRARLAAALVETTARAQDGENRVAATERRLDVSISSEEAIRRSLESRRGVIADVLAALQRMGRRPPPAVLVNPEDILQAIRTSMLLGAVVPELRAETEALASDLADLVQARKSIATERDALRMELATLAGERARIAALVEARQASLAQAEQALEGERAKARDLARQAIDLKDLVGRMENEVASAGRAADTARKVEQQRQEANLRAPSAPFKDAARLAPAIAFADARGMLPLPVSGSLLKPFGAPDGFGGTEKGLSLATRPGSVVASPTDGWIAFSGPYRTYGQLLIINAGGGYYVVLAGMEHINVNVGQFVLVGEPVAVMGDGSAKTAAAIAIGSAQPVLYVEFRKDGAAIDPGPWWVKPELEKVRG
jgi:septal ring factor EnvC (AmiA/AmiB activator)